MSVEGMKLNIFSTTKFYTRKRVFVYKLHTHTFYTYTVEWYFKLLISSLSIINHVYLHWFDFVFKYDSKHLQNYILYKKVNHLLFFKTSSDGKIWWKLFIYEYT